MTPQRLTPEQAIARLPSVAGYALTHNHFAVILADANSGRSDRIAVVEWAKDGQGRPMPDRDYAASLTLTLAKSGLATNSDIQAFLVGYGPRGKSRVDELTEMLHQGGFTWEYIGVHVDDNEVRFKFEKEGLWNDPTPLPDVSAELVYEGKQLPAQTRNEYKARFAPEASPLFHQVSDLEAARFNKQSPKAQVEESLFHLSALSEGTGDRSEHMAKLAHGILHSDVVRDCVYIEAAKSDRATDSLIHTYQASPSNLRGELAPVAATCAYLNYKPLPVVEAITAHTTPEGRNARLGQLVLGVAKTGTHPGTVRQTLHAVAFAELDKAQKAFERSQRLSTAFPQQQSPGLKASKGEATRSRSSINQTRSTERDGRLF